MATTQEAPAQEALALREFHFTQRDFARIKALIYNRAGIALSDSKQDLVYGRLARRLRQLGLDNFNAYIAVLEDRHSPEWEHFTNALTTNLTSFFRESHHFDMLRDFLLHNGSAGCSHIWCAASSTGEEPYSIAMTAAQSLRRSTDSVRILATDIDTHVLHRAASGVYAEEAIASFPLEKKRSYFLRGTGPHEGTVRVRPELREMVSFMQLNLLDKKWPVKQTFDVIFCRNVLIYFDKETQLDVLNRLGHHLRTGGLLFIGHSENPALDRDEFEALGRTAYRKK